MTTYIYEFIDYNDETSPFSTLESTLKNVPKIFPKVKAEKLKQKGCADSLVLSSRDKEQLKRAYLAICYADGMDKYDQLKANGTLEDELESIGFYD